MSDIFFGYRGVPHLVIAVTRMENGRPWVIRATFDNYRFNELVDDIICVNVDLKGWKQLEGFLDTSRIRPIQLDGSSPKAIAALLAQDVDVAIDLLPLPLMGCAFDATLEAGVPLVSTNYGKPIRRLHSAAVAAGVALMPECGLDPGIDLIIYYMLKNISGWTQKRLLHRGT